MRTLAALVVVGLAIGCTTTKLDVGSNDGGSGGADSSAPDSGSTSLRFTGFFESFAFQSGSDAVSFVVTVANDGSVSGTVRLGAQRDIPAPTDPNAAYPPEYLQPGYGDTVNKNAGVEEGFTYPVVKGTFSGGRLRLAINTASLWGAWCKLQTQTYPSSSWDDAGIYNCVQDCGIMGGDDAGSCRLVDPQGNECAMVSCPRAMLCLSGACSCTATGCTARLEPFTSTYDPYKSAIALDVVIAGDVADGSATGLLFTDGQRATVPVNVHLTRQ